MSSLTADSNRRLKVVASLAAIYLVWGSTYLGIRIAIETWPPLIMAGGRFFLAGLSLYVWERCRGTPKPEPAQWRMATITGALLVTLGNGGVTLAAAMVPSGLIALLLAVTPLWMVLFDLWWGNKIQLRKRVWAGVGLGFIGAGLLVAPGRFGGGEHVHLFGAVALAVASIAWAGGSLLTRQGHLPSRQLLSTGMQLMAGGGLLLIVAAGMGEFGRFSVVNLSLRSTLATLYLMIFSSLIAYCAYVYLLRTTSMAVVSTYGYVNPLIAVALGAWLGGELITPRMAVAGVAIIAGVVLIIMAPAQRPAEPVEPVEPV